MPPLENVLLPGRIGIRQAASATLNVGKLVAIGVDGCVLSSGTKLGPCQMTASLEAGGMGELYCARDSRLGRYIAIKVHPESLSPDRLRKFDRKLKAFGDAMQGGENPVSSLPTRTLVAHLTGGLT